jgi:hypothetical protein
MFLNVLKGAYPGLQQIDLALPMAVGQTGIERGSLLKINSDREWEVATSSDIGSGTVPGAFVYIALMGQDDLVAGMAGDVGQGVISAAAGQPIINALSIVPTIQIETDMFDPEADWNVGDWAMVDDGGVFTVLTDGSTAIAKVDAVPATRWVNNAVAVTGWRTGAPRSVIRLSTVYIPSLSIS